jgi:hypothetical protein
MLVVVDVTPQVGGRDEPMRNMQGEQSIQTVAGKTLKIIR